MKERTYQIVLDGIVITVTKKRIKNMYLRIKKEDGMVLISAPYQMSDLRIRRFAEERLPWIREYQKKYKELKQQNDLKPALSEAEIRRRKVLLKAAVEKLIQKYEPLMQVQVSGVTIRQMKTRWGSCNVKTHHININLALYEKGPECLEYVVAHGISSMVEGKKVIIGSAHFVFEDEGCRIPEGEKPKFDALPSAYSQLYLCIDGELAAVICIHDPLRREAREAVRALHESGFANVVMMTGDNRRTAEAVAAEVGVDAVYAEVLPEDKAAFIRQEKEKGHTVIMVGDGVNDSPALSEADAGIAISTGAAIAREIADITVASEDLFALVTLRRLGEALMERIHGSYRFIVGFNLALIALGVAGVLPPTTSALLHNGSTLGISLRNMTDLLDDEENTQK